MVRVLEREQWLPISPQEAWEFFSTPLNLAKITPPEMGFRIREPFDKRSIWAGQRITYRVSPLLGIPLTWVTCIALVDAPHRFVDVQVKGPYKRWWHQHTFTAKDGGTLMHDRVEYELPFGVLGNIVHALVVREELVRIFDFRSRTLEHFFGKGR